MTALPPDLRNLLLPLLDFNTLCSWRALSSSERRRVDSFVFKPLLRLNNGLTFYLTSKHLVIYYYIPYPYVTVYSLPLCLPLYSAPGIWEDMNHIESDRLDPPSTLRCRDGELDIPTGVVTKCNYGPRGPRGPRGVRGPRGSRAFDPMKSYLLAQSAEYKLVWTNKDLILCNPTVQVPLPPKAQWFLGVKMIVEAREYAVPLPLALKQRVLAIPPTICNGVDYYLCQQMVLITSHSKLYIYLRGLSYQWSWVNKFRVRYDPNVGYHLLIHRAQNQEGIVELYHLPYP